MSNDKEPRNTSGLNRGGRPKGSPNKFTVHAKEAMQMAFDRLGGVDRLVRWAQADDNLGDFYKLYARLIPMEVTGKDGADLFPAASATDVAREALFMMELAQREPRKPTPTQH